MVQPCRHDTLPKIILQGSMDGRRRRGRSRKSWKDNIKEWMGQSMSLLHITDDRSRWAAITASAELISFPLFSPHYISSLINRYSPVRHLRSSSHSLFVQPQNLMYTLLLMLKDSDQLVLASVTPYQVMLTHLSPSPLVLLVTSAHSLCLWFTYYTCAIQVHAINSFTLRYIGDSTACNRQMLNL